MVCLCQKEKNAVKLQKVIFENHRNCFNINQAPQRQAYSENSIAIHLISMAGYVTTIPAFIHGELLACEVSSFCDFLKNDLGLSPHFPPFLTQANLSFLDLLNKDNYS